MIDHNIQGCPTPDKPRLLCHASLTDLILSTKLCNVMSQFSIQRATVVRLNYDIVKVR